MIARPFSVPLFIALTISFRASAQEQFVYIGLGGRTVYDLFDYHGKIYAGTDTGAFVRDDFTGSGTPSDTVWKLIGLAGKRVRAIYPHDYGPIGYAVTAGIDRSSDPEDSVLTYCTFMSDTAWAPSDSGMDRSRIHSVQSIRGFPSLAICGETFAVTGGFVFRRAGTPWEKVLDIGIGSMNVVRTDSRNATVWAGGENGTFAPVIAKSTDRGDSWTTTSPLPPDNACDALEFDPGDSSIVYAGMEGSVIRSTDGGISWNPSSLAGTPYYFFGLAADPFFPILYAGGSTSGNLAGLYVSRDQGKSWDPVAVPWTDGGILCVALLPTQVETSFL